MNYRGQWKQWYAWHPVFLDYPDKGLVWLTRVWRRWEEWGMGHWCKNPTDWEYRLTKPEEIGEN